MKHNKLWRIIGVTLLIAALLCVAAGCNGTTGSGTEGATVPGEPGKENALLLSQTEAKLGIGGTLQLTAQVQGADGNVVWSSSDDTVATVWEGEIMGMQEGNAIITAAVGSLTAQCRVSVSADVPALVLSPQYAVVDLQEKTTVTAQVMVGGESYHHPVTYRWFWDAEAEKIISVKPAEDGSSAVITGLSYGDATVYVDVKVGGVSLTKKLTVACRNTDITIEVVGNGISPTVGGYHMSLELATSATPSVTVYNKDSQVSSSKIKWSVSDSSVATVSSSGTITALKEGSAVVTGVYGEQNNKVRIFVNVYRPVIFMDTKYVIETSDGELTVTDTLNGTIQGATINGVDVFGSVEGNTITFKTGGLPTQANQMGAGRSLVIHTDRAQYTYSAQIYSKIITTADEFMNMEDYMHRSVGSNGYWQYTGLVVLGNDIDLQGAAFNLFEDIQIDPDAPAGDRNRAQMGFNGIFDGQGYSVKNYTATPGHDAMFTHMGLQGVIRNVAIENVVAPAGTGNILMRTQDGQLENIYISVSQWDEGALISSPWRDLRILKNIVIEYTGEAIPDWRDITGHSGDGSQDSQFYLHRAGNISNVYILGDIGTVKTGCELSGCGGSCGFHSYRSIQEALGRNYSAFSGDFWNISGGIPVPQSIYEERVGIQVSVENTQVNGQLEALRGESTALLANTPYVVWSLEGQYPGVTLTGNQLTVAEDSTATAVTVKVSNLFDRSIAVTADIYLYSKTVQTLDALGDLELKKTADQTHITLDLSKIEPIGQVASVVIEGQLLGADQITADAENKTVSVPIEALQPYYGKTVSIAVNCKDGDSYIQGTTTGFVVTKVIKTAEDFNTLTSCMDVVGGKYTGYVVLGNDVDFSGTALVPQFQQAEVGGVTAELGMHGIIDGRGHSLTGIRMNSGSGIFGVVGKSGVLKNMLIQIESAKVNILARAFWGTMEDVYISLKGWQEGTLLNIPFASNQAVANRVVIELEEKAPDISNAVNYGNNAVNSVTDSYIIGSFPASITNFAGFAHYDNRVEMAGADNSYTAFPDSFWDVSGGTPVPGKLVQERLNQDITVLNVQKVLEKDSSLVLTANVDYVAWSLQTAHPGITLEGNTLTASKDAGSGYITVIATNVYNSEKTDSITLEVTQVSEQHLDNAGDVEVGGTEATLDLSKADSFTQIMGVEVNGVGLTYTADTNSVTVSTTALKELVGQDVSFRVTCQTATGYNTVNIPAFLVSKVIKTAADFNTMESYMNVRDGKYTGYVVFGNDIDFSTTPLAPQFQQATVGGVANNLGLNGTIDGRGYTMLGVNMISGSGIFGVMGKDAVLKNLAIEIDTASTNVLARACWGSLEDVYVRVNTWTAGAILNVPYSTTVKLTRVVFEFLGGNGYKPSDGVGYQTVTDSYIIGDFADNTVDMRDVPQYDDRGSMATAGEYGAFTTGDPDFWKLEADGTPIPKNAAHVHNFTLEVVKPEYLATVATNMAPATYYYSCACGEHGTETFSYGAPIIAVNLGDIELNADDSSTVSIRLGELSGTVSGVSLNDSAMNASEYTVEGQTLTLNKALLREHLGKAVVLQVHVDAVSYPYNAFVVSKILKTAAEFNNLMSYLDKMAANANFNSYTGYLVLGNDIDFADTAAAGLFRRDAGTNSIRIADGGNWNDGAIGFNGTLDGRNYAIRNLTVSSGRGWLGLIGSNGLIKNLAITDVVASCGDEVLLMNNKGTVQDVYISLKSWTNGNLFGQWFSGGKMTRVVAECIGTAPAAPKLFASTSTPTMTDGYAVGLSAATNPGSFTLYADRTAMDTAGNYTQFTVENGSFWILDSKGTPLPKSLAGVPTEPPAEKEEVSLTMPSISTLELLGQSQVAVDLQAEGVTAITGVTVNGTAVAEGGFTRAGSKLLLNTKELTAYYGKGVSLVIVYETSTQAVTATCAVTEVVSKVITTPQEFNNLMTYLDKAQGDSLFYTYTGYLVLGNDLDFAGITPTMHFQRNNTSQGVLTGTDNTGWGQTNYGFNGTLDGRGYAIKNLTVPNGRGLFGICGINSVIRNISFLNVTANGGTENFFMNNKGLVEDVYFGISAWQSGYLFGQWNYGGTFHRVIFELTGTVPSDGKVLAYSSGSPKMTDCYIIGATGLANPGDFRMYADRGAMAADGNDYSAFTGFWKLDGKDTPVPV